jgi:hypothetical protein
MLSLAKAIKENRLDEFIREQELEGIGPVQETDFLMAASKVIKTSQQSAQTPRSPSSGDLTGK